MHVRLNLSNSAENIPTVRQALAGFGEAVALQPLELNDIRTALTEACNNASIHAYSGAEGPMEVELSASANAVGVAVRDRGGGLIPTSGLELPHPTDDELPALGLPAIRTLARRVRLSARDGGGTEVAMCFETPHIRLFEESAPVDGFDVAGLSPAWLGNTVELDMAPLETARLVFPRVLRAMAARAFFTIDRLEDAQRIGGALLADADSIGADRIRGVVAATPEAVELAVGPVTPGMASSLSAAVREIEPSIEALAAHHFLAGDQADGRLALRLRRTR